MTTSIQGVGSVSSVGLGSGIDASAIISQLMAVESRPLDQLKTQATEINAQLSTFGKLQSLAAGLKDRAGALTSSTLWRQTTATSSNPTAVMASTQGSTAPGSFTVEVSRLAQAQSTVTATSFASVDSVVGEGDLSIEIGTWNGSVFMPLSSGSPVNLHIAAGSTLAQVRDQINAASAGVTASIVVDAGGARLSMRSLASGVDNAFRVVGSGGGAVLDYSGAAGGMTLTRPAANAAATINGIDIVSSSNTLENVVDGMTLKLQTTTTAPVDVTVATDSESIRKAITDFASAFNELATFIREQTRYEPNSKTAGALQGDRAAVGLQGQMRAIINQTSTASPVWGMLSQVGLVLKSDGTFETKGTTLENALARPAELQKLLAGDGADAASQGFARRFKTWADTVLGSEGPFDTRTQSLRAQLTRNGKDQDRMTQRLAQTESRLRAQYTALDAAMAQLNGLSNYMSGQLAALSNNNR